MSDEVERCFVCKHKAGAHATKDGHCAMFGCTCRQPQRDSGSSVPEAARAAARDALVPHSFNARYTVNTDGSWTWKCSCGHEYAHGVEIATQEVEHRAAAVVEAASPALVAAAVAEERATTGRRDAERERYIKTLVKERDTAERKVHAVETVTCWTNEDGKRFMFVDDVAVALEIPGSRAALESPGESE